MDYWQTLGRRTAVLPRSLLCLLHHRSDVSRPSWTRPSTAWVSLLKLFLLSNVLSVKSKNSSLPTESPFWKDWFDKLVTKGSQEKIKPFLRLKLEAVRPSSSSLIANSNDFWTHPNFRSTRMPKVGSNPFNCPTVTRLSQRGAAKLQA